MLILYPLLCLVKVL